MQNNTKALSALSYLSVFFAPFLLPLIVYFVSKDLEVKHHAKRAFISHFLTIILSIILVFIFVFTIFNTQNNTFSTSMLILPIVSILVFLVACAVIFIWNIIQAVKVAR